MSASAAAAAQNSELLQAVRGRDAAAAREFPQFNAVVDMATETVIYRQYVNVGVAVDTDRGLLVPVVRGADRMGVGDGASDDDLGESGALLEAASRLPEPARLALLEGGPAKGLVFTPVAEPGNASRTGTPLKDFGPMALEGLTCLHSAS